MEEILYVNLMTERNKAFTMLKAGIRFLAC